MNEADFRNKLTLINGKWDPRIKLLKKELSACERKLASLGTPVPGRLPPVLSAKQVVEQRVLEKGLQSLVQKLNQASRDWLAELLKVPAPTPAAGLKGKIRWPSWVGPKGKDFVTRSIEQGGIPVTDHTTIKKMPGTWTGIMVEYNW